MIIYLIPLKMIKRQSPSWVHWYNQIDKEDYSNAPEAEKAEQDYLNEQDNLATQN